MAFGQFTPISKFIESNNKQQQRKQTKYPSYPLTANTNNNTTRTNTSTFPTNKSTPTWAAVASSNVVITNDNTKLEQQLTRLESQLKDTQELITKCKANAGRLTAQIMNIKHNLVYQVDSPSIHHTNNNIPNQNQTINKTQQPVATTRQHYIDLTSQRDARTSTTPEIEGIINNK